MDDWQRLNQEKEHRYLRLSELRKKDRQEAWTRYRSGHLTDLSIAVEEAKHEERERIIQMLDKNFSLAPESNLHFRILIQNTLDFLKTGKRSAERARENYEKFQALKEGE